MKAFSRLAVLTAMLFCTCPALQAQEDGLIRKLGNVYADYIDPGIFSFVEGQERKELFINAVERLCKYISYE